MREILFRGFALRDIETEELPIGISKGQEIQGQLVFNAGETYIVGELIEATDEYIAVEYWIPVDAETVGQYTGLPDRNGTKIFEGDIVEHQEERCTVHFNEGCFWVTDDDCTSTMSEFYPIDLEVIGNVHDNPEEARE